MAESSRHDPANSNTITQQEYEDMNAPHQPSGVVGAYGDTSIVYADGSARAVKIRANKRAKVRGRTWYNDAAEAQLAIAANASGSTRIDTIVLRLSRSNWQVRLAVVQGAPGAGAPALTQQTDSGATVWELPLADVTVGSGVAVINAGNVVTREWYIGSDNALVMASATTKPVGFGHGQRLWLADIRQMWIHNGTAFSPAPGTLIAEIRRTSDVAATTLETLADSITFTYIAGSKVEFDWEGLHTATAALDNCVIRIRYAAGASVSNASTELKPTLRQPPAANSAIGVKFIADNSLVALPVGQVTVGVFVVRVAGTGTHTLAASAAWPTDFKIKAI